MGWEVGYTLDTMPACCKANAERQMIIYTHTHIMGNVESPVNPVPLTSFLWTVGGNQNTRREPMHTQREYGWLWGIYSSSVAVFQFTEWDFVVGAPVWYWAMDNMSFEWTSSGSDHWINKGRFENHYHRWCGSEQNKTGSFLLNCWCNVRTWWCGIVCSQARVKASHCSDLWNGLEWKQKKLTAIT